MNHLEDHIGDIAKKARKGKGLELDRLANRVSIDTMRLHQFENTGTGLDSDALRKLAEVLELNAEKYVHLPDYVPALIELSRWGSLGMLTTDYKGMQVNLFAAWDPKTKEAALFDTGTEIRKVHRFIDEHQLNLKHIFLTHTHTDHVLILDELWQKYLPQVYVSHTSPYSNAVLVSEGDRFQVGSLQVEALETAGHSIDGVTYLVSKWPQNLPEVAVVGDAIFAGSLGGGLDSFQKLKTNVVEKIMSLPENTLLCPGHGPLTTVGQEKLNNPFFS